MQNKLYSIFLLLLPVFSIAQIIPLTNPSFEDMPRHSRVPRGWYDCGFPGESGPDTQPDPTFGVYKEAYDGKTYVGMVVRDNDTWESIAQKFPKPLQRDSCYTFSIYAARSEEYMSISRITEEQANYVTPAKIQIFGGFDYCDKREQLGSSKLIIGTKWEQIKLSFTAKEKYTHLVIEAYYKTPTLFPYNGNVLIDKAQLIKGCGNDTLNLSVNEREEDVMSQENIKLPKEEKPRIEDIKTEQPAPPALPTELPKDVDDLKAKIIKYGQHVRFVKTTALLETSDFVMNGQEFNNENQYLVYLAKAMQQFPGYRLVISVDGQENAKYERVLHLQDALLKWGLDIDHSTVYPYNVLDTKKPWLWSATNNEMWMQLVRIK